MKEVSENYSVKMGEQFRNESHIRITMNNGATTYTFLDDDILSATKSDDVDPLSRRVPKETFSFSLFDYNGDYNPSNPSGKWSSMDENAEIEVEFGFDISDGTTEWLEKDTYLLDAKPTVSNGIATFKASSKLCHLTKTYYKGVVETNNLYDLAVSVLTDAGIDEESYSIDESLKDISTDSPIPVTTHLNALQLIAHASGCTLRTKSGKIEIAPLVITGDPSEFILSLSSIAYGGDTISKIETLYKVEAGLYKYTEDSEVSTLATFYLEASEETECHVEYDLSKDQTITVSEGCEISDIKTYAEAADFTLTGSGTFEVTVTGKKVTQNTSTTEVIASLNTEGTTDSEKNQLISSYATQHSLIYKTANYLSYRMTHSVKYRGNPELEPLDLIYLETQYGTYIKALILTHTISYGGAISGTLTLKSLSEIKESYLYDAKGDYVYDVNDEKISIVGMTDYLSDYTTDEMESFITEVLNE